MAKPIQPWEAEVDEGSATPTPKPVVKPKPIPPKPKTVPVGQAEVDDGSIGKKCGGKIKKYARGGGIEIRGKTKGRFV
jgi:hypothetical protein